MENGQWTDDNVSLLLQELHITNLERYELVQAVRQTIYSVVPDASERVMYAGFMFSGEVQFCGVFAYRAHVFRVTAQETSLKTSLKTSVKTHVEKKTPEQTTDL